MGEPLRVLIVEDKARDAKLMALELERAGFDPRWERVETEGDYVHALASAPDVILADGSMPGFDALRALDLLREQHHGTPLIVVTGSLSDERAVEFMKHGADDYLLKDRLARLGQAVHGAIERRRLAERTRRYEEERDRFFRLSVDMLCVAGFDGYFKLLNPAWEPTLGWTAEELLARPYLDFVHPDDRAATVAQADRLGAGLQTHSFENRYRCKDGSYRWLSWRSAPDPARRLVYATARDKTDQRRAEAELRLRDRAIQAVSQGIVIADPNLPDCPIVYASAGFEQLTGYPSGEVVGRNCRLLQGKDTDPAAVARLRAAVRDGLPCTVELLNYRRDGTAFWNEVSVSPVRDAAGRLTHFVGVQADVTERRRTQDELRDWKDRYEAAVRATGQVLYEWDPVADTVIYSGNVQATLGYSPAELSGELGRWVEIVHPDDRAAFTREADRAHRAGEPFQLEYRVLRKDRKVIVVRDEGHFVTRRGVGRALMVGLVADVTEARRLEAQLRQAQKMEAVGRLAGGVAHDFNNLLTIIIGYGQIVTGALPPNEPSRELVEEITKAGDRAAGLTRQLLAFSRQTVLEPKVLDPNALIRDLEKMLRRLIGEDIDLRTSLVPDAGRIKADPGQLEQTLVNLCVNARDAMPDGGELTIETRNTALDESDAARHPDVRPGPYVLLAVTDTGTGIPAEVQARIFEPFFTTKGPGKGTGLGLAMVFGFVQQSGGHVAVCSELNRGTTFKVYLPQVGEAPTGGRSGAWRSALPRGTETVLLVEDEEAVRALGRYVLKMCGYSVLESGNGRDAVRVAEAHRGPIHLLVTDVVMPGGMGGRQVAEAVAALRPGVKVLYTSGYTDDAVVRHGVLEEGTHFLQKPFTPAALAGKVREVLDRPAAGSGAAPPGDAASP